MGQFVRRSRVEALALAAGVALLLSAAAPAVQNPATPPTDQERSVKPGINERWKSDEIAPLVATLEDEGREIFSQRDRIAALVGPRKGSVVADVGAGSGFMAELFADLVGPEGKVFAVDINPVLMKRVAEDAQKKELTNLDVVVCGERDVNLPAESIDLMFICDTYHHFEYPVSTMKSVYEALKPGGQIVVVDFYRIEGVTPQWLMEHVRAGEEVFTQEIVDAGFELMNQHYPAYLPQNYVLRFRKVEKR
jgi:precorrin-6B methylase 2